MTGGAKPATLALVNDKGSVERSWSLDEGRRTVSLGRAPENDVVLPGAWVSRRHAMIQREEGGSHSIIDLGSANGTFVNGGRVHTPTRLRSGDLIQIGSRTTLTFFSRHEPAAPTVFDDEDERTVAFLEKEHITILICDIRNFTSLSEQIGDTRISSLLKRWSRAVSKIVAAHQGRIDKFIGDAVMALWPGAALRRHVHLALLCAGEIHRATARLGEAEGALPAPLRVCAAINTGEAVVGNIGVDGQRDFTAVGDAVNVAFRLEGLAGEPGRDILVGGDAVDHLDPVARDFFSPGEYQVKGKAKPVRALGTDFSRLAAYLRQIGG